MKVQVYIDALPSDVGEHLWPEAKRVAPQLCTTPRIGFVDEDHPEVRALLKLTRSHGIPEYDYGAWPLPTKHIVVHRRRVYTEADLKTSPLLYVRAARRQPTYPLFDDKLARLAFKSRTRPVGQIFGQDDSIVHNHRIWMLTETIQNLKATQWRGVMFKQAMGRDAYVVAAGYHVWEDAKELSSNIVMPPVVRDIQRVPRTAKDGEITHEPIDWICSMRDQGFQDVLPRFYANELPPLESWDIAISHEYFLPKQKQDRMIFVSQRVRRQLIKAKLDHLLQWTPCGIEPGPRPKT
jgi:hypothetical protein